MRTETGPIRGFLVLAAACFLAGAGVTIADIAARIVFLSNVPAAIELTTLFIGLGALISMPVCYARRSHVTARLVSEFLPDWIGRILAVFGAALSLVFAVTLFLLLAINLSEKFGGPEITPDTGLPVHILLLVVCAALGLAVLAAIRGFWGAVIGEEADG